MTSSSRPSPHVRLLIASWPVDAPRGAVEAFCIEHGVSRSWFYKVRARADAGGIVAAVAPVSTRPQLSPTRTSDDMIELLALTRSQLKDAGMDYGPLSVLARLRRQGFTDLPSRATLARLFTQAGMVVAEPRKKPRSAFRRFVYPAPNCLWQIDATQWTLSTGVVVVIFQLLDDHSRRALASLVARGETAEAAVRVVRLAIGRHGVPQKFLSDNGLAFNPSRRGYTGKLVDYLTSLGVVTVTGKPYKPTTQGKNERFHQTLHKYLNAHPPAATIDQLQDLVDAFDQYYNTEREHQSLDGHRTPQEAWDLTAPVASPTPPPPVIIVPTIPPETITKPSAGVLALLAHAHARASTPPGSAIRTVTNNGRVNVLNIEFRLGAHYRGQQIHIHWTHTELDFFDSTGTLITSHPMPAKGTRTVGKTTAKTAIIHASTQQ